MTAEQFKQIRDYLTANRFKGQKWPQEAIGKVMLSTRQSVNNWEKGFNPVPQMIAERLIEMLHECGIEKVQNGLKEAMMSKVHTPPDLEQFLEKISNL